MTTDDELSLPERADLFFDFATEIADGERWKVLRAEGWEDMNVRLADVIGDLPVRRRQALMMLLFSMVEELVTPDEVRDWLADHDLAPDEGIEELITWLRGVRRSRE